uniref:Uncharacterized protein n=1 Tax=Candidatus Kentrum sp. MB TaxID=2138164 RepID=A0A450XQY7_9GAMM|nr:MAG: hypothetical protein BECKMB1821G_GA0114241_101416 [Candidatus Kentron sp. MB]VFK31700.1 MAG: hypothetical protein BECKMB1821I_GA0114274_102618 [Candidatus Kentron sp. MB]VFK75618.1 MAG: hypothetical protein BECKMB1821H_GA0114242_102717 [Candidatus Kentron sp. MB]
MEFVGDFRLSPFFGITGPELGNTEDTKAPEKPWAGRPRTRAAGWPPTRSSAGRKAPRGLDRCRYRHRNRSAPLWPAERQPVCVPRGAEPSTRLGKTSQIMDPVMEYQRCCDDVSMSFREIKHGARRLRCPERTVSRGTRKSGVAHELP